MDEVNGQGLANLDDILHSLVSTGQRELDTDDPRWDELSRSIEEHLSTVLRQLNGFIRGNSLRVLDHFSRRHDVPAAEDIAEEAAEEDEEALPPDEAAPPSDEAASPSDAAPARPVTPPISVEDVTTRIAAMFRDEASTTASRLPVVRYLLGQVRELRQSATTRKNRALLDSRSTSLRQRIKMVHEDTTLTPQDKSKLVFTLMNEHHTPDAAPKRVVETEHWTHYAMLEFDDDVDAAGEPLEEGGVSALRTRVNGMLKEPAWLSDEAFNATLDALRVFKMRPGHFLTPDDASKDTIFGGIVLAETMNSVTPGVEFRSIKPDSFTVDSLTKEVAMIARLAWWRARGYEDWDAINEHTAAESPDDHPNSFAEMSQEQQDLVIGAALGDLAYVTIRAMKVHKIGRARGCRHYIRGVMAWCKECGEYYTCRLCHDEQDHGHAFDRRGTERCRCMKCGEEQPPAQDCRACGARFADEFCSHCNLWETHPSKPIYHCEKCAICRVGSSASSRHCDGCGLCFPMDAYSSHRCPGKVKDVDNPCPICAYHLNATRDSILTVPCGHQMHSKCHHGLLERYIYTCPACHKLMLTGSNKKSWETWRGRAIDEQPTPQEYSHHRTQVLCNECCHKWSAPLHFVGYRCPECGTHNTAAQ